MVDDDNEPCKVLHVIDIQSGDILQSVRFELEGHVAAILVDGDEIYIVGFLAHKVVVLQFAGSDGGVRGRWSLRGRARARGLCFSLCSTEVECRVACVYTPCT